MLQSNGSRYGTYSSSSDRDFASTLEEFIIMVIVMALAAGIRLWKLGEWSFWADEVFSVQTAQSLKFPDEIPGNPIMYMIVRFFIDTFGLSEWSARLGPCIIGIISVPLLYWPARRMFNAKVGVIACVFLVIHPWHIYWSQNARAYSLAFLFGGLAAFTFYLGLERDKVGLMVLSVLLTLLSIFSQLQSVILLAALAGYVVLIMFIPAGMPRGFNGKNLITFFAPFILSLFVLLSPSVRGYLMEGLGVNQLGRSPLYLLFTLVYCLGIPIVVAAFVGGVHSLIYMNRGGLFLICYAIIPLLALLIISPFQNVHGYYLFFTVPAYLLLAAFCASELMDSIARRSRIMSAAVILIVIAGLISQDYLYFRVENGGRPKWREAFKAVEHRIEQDDIVVVSMPQIADHYLWGYADKSPPAGVRSDPSTRVVQLKNVINQLGTYEDQWRRRSQHIWFVLDQLSLSVADADGSFREWIHSNCHLVETFPVYTRVRDRTINVWSLKYTFKIDLPDEFDDFIF